MACQTGRPGAIWRHSWANGREAEIGRNKNDLLGAVLPYNHLLQTSPVTKISANGENRQFCRSVVREQQPESRIPGQTDKVNTKSGNSCREGSGPYGVLSQR